MIQTLVKLWSVVGCRVGDIIVCPYGEGASSPSHIIYYLKFCCRHPQRKLLLLVVGACLYCGRYTFTDSTMCWCKQSLDKMMWARCLLLCLTHQTYAKSHYPSLNELCSKSAHRAGKHESVDIYRRPQCLHTGSYYKDVNGALLTNATGFYSYNDVAHWDQDAR